MTVAVVDASVLAAVAFGEPRADEAARRLRGVELHAPILLAFELANVAVIKSRRFPTDAAGFERGLESILSLALTWEPVSPVEVCRLADETGLSAYDAAYLWVAFRLEAPLLTFDRSLEMGAHQLGLS